MSSKTNRLLALLIEKLKTYSSECEIELEDASFLISFSGGIDSTIMASLMVEIRKIYNLIIGFAHINHQSHNKSEKVEKFCSQYSLDKDVVFHSHILFIDSQRNFESCARKQRYTILNNIAEKYSYQFILTAHHEDDQLETMYMKKIDGGDWISQIGIRERMGKLRRPFLNISKKEINEYAKDNDIFWIEDPTNKDLNIRRNNIRYKQLPIAYRADSRLKYSLLNISNKNILKLQHITKLLKQEQGNIIKDCSKDCILINRNELMKYNVEQLKLFLYTSIADLLKFEFIQQSGGLWREFKNFINKSNTGSIFQIDTLTFLINRDEIIVMDNYNKFKNSKKLRLCHDLLWFSSQFKTRNKNTVCLQSPKNKLMLPGSLYQDGLYIRAWMHGDRMVSATSQKHVSLSDLYINNKLSIYEKLTQPVVVDKNDIILWIPGLLHGNINYNDNHKIKVIHWIQR